MWAEVVADAARDAGTTGVLGAVDSLEVVYCQTWQYDDAPRRLAERLGIDPPHCFYSGIGGTTVRLPRQIPWPQAMEFLLCADLIPAQRAYDMGFLNAVVPRDELLDKAYEFARRITANGPLAVRATKQSVWEGLSMNLPEAYANESRISPTSPESVHDSRCTSRAGTNPMTLNSSPRRSQ